MILILPLMALISCEALPQARETASESVVDLATPCPEDGFLYLYDSGSFSPAVCAQHADGGVYCVGSEQSSWIGHDGPVRNVVPGSGALCIVTGDATLACYKNDADVEINPPNMDEVIDLKYELFGDFVTIARVDDRNVVSYWDETGGPQRVLFDSGSDLLPTPWIQVESNPFHVCARSALGQLVCENWRNEGIETLDFPSWSGVVDIALSYDSACALYRDHTVVCVPSSDAERSEEDLRFMPKEGDWIEIIGLGSGFCARTIMDSLDCWGGAYFDQWPDPMDGFTLEEQFGSSWVLSPVSLREGTLYSGQHPADECYLVGEVSVDNS